ncbi:hypothetical protein L6452_28311 [Arctium lappa]|uniref:Uncharacterized protein n=1 Tax=Arctium lappa TaxID=4217 RepID=A0ACB8ZY44_ARCLA|nr:hypothetical protein L6452_28311 [Arctium lappa]
MENLPETLYIDPTAATSSTTATGPESAAVDRAKIEQCIQLLHQPSGREEALALLNKERRSKEMPVLLWNSKNISFILLQEVCAAYKLLSPPALGMKEATRVCNAIALFQSMASHPDTKMAIVKAKIPVYIYPFLNTTEQRHKHFDYLRLTSLGVIGALVKTEDSNSQEIIHFLLETQVFPLCLRCIEVGGELAKTVATFVVSKILTYEEGQRYCGSFPERFYAVVQVLTKIVDQFPGKPSLQLLKHILTCFMRLSEVSRPCDALSKCYPARLRDPAYLNFVCEEPTVRRFADQVLHHVTTHSHRLG